MAAETHVNLNPTPANFINFNSPDDGAGTASTNGVSNGTTGANQAPGKSISIVVGGTQIAVLQNPS